MSKIILHIGTHKTATTTLQDTFYQNRHLLAKHGVVYPKVGLLRGHHGLASKWIRMPLPYSLQNPDRVWKKLRTSYADKDVTVLISSEEFSRANPVRVDMAALRARLAGFDEVQVICTLRNQKSYIQSIYQQTSKERAVLPFEQFLAQALSSRFADGLWLNYNALYEHLLTGFAPEELRFVSYEEAVRHPGGIIGEYLELLGLPLTAADLEPFGAGTSNVSPEALAMYVANAVAFPDKATPGLVGLADDMLGKAFGPETRTTLFTRPEVDRLAAHFNPANREFEARIAAYQPGFRIPDITVQQDLIHRGQLKPSHWAAMARILHRTLGQRD